VSCFNCCNVNELVLTLSAVTPSSTECWGYAERKNVKFPCAERSTTPSRLIYL